MNDRELLTALDACRPGESVWDDPALGDAARALAENDSARQLHDRVQQLDRRLDNAFRDSPIPEGLTERLLARLAANVSAKPIVGDDAATIDSADRPAMDVPVNLAPAACDSHQVRRIGRRLAILAGISAVAAAVLVAVKYWPQPADPWTSAQLLDAAISFYASDTRQGKSYPLSEAPADAPPSRDLVDMPRSTRWRQLAAGPAGAETVAYDISLSRAGPQATLYVASSFGPVVGLPDQAPPTPSTPTTQGVCASVWQHEGVLYLLVVEGGPREYQQFLRNLGGAVAWAGTPVNAQSRTPHG